MKRWANEIKKVETGKIRGRGKEVNLTMIAVNNHYAGFGTGTANLFRKMVGLRVILGRSVKIKEQVRFELQQENQAQQSGNSSKVQPKITKKTTK